MEPTPSPTEVINTPPPPPPGKSLTRSHIILFSIIGVLLLALVATLAYTMGTKNTQPANTTENTTTTTTPTPTLSTTPTSTSSASPNTTSAPAATIALASSLCPVKFGVPSEKILIQGTNQYDTWQIKETDGERFMYIPRAEEKNGKRTQVELRGENQVEGNGEATVAVYCQDNPNKWTTDQLLEYMKKADEVANVQATKMTMWGKDVYKVNFTHTYNNQADVTYIFATPTKLFHVDQIFWTGNYTDQANKIFNTLLFQ